MAETVHSRNRTSIAIIGAGAGGICIGRDLLRAGLDDFVLFERTGSVGGTWARNRYPGLACDIPSFLYSYSFAPKPDWSHVYARQPEILAYLEACATEAGILPFIRFDTEIMAARWDEDAALWRIEDATGATHEAEVLISALGMFNKPAWPRIDGLETFAGQVIHTSDWPAAPDIPGRHVAVVGSAASAIQLIPEVARQARQLTVFQRSANWVMIKPDAEHPPQRLQMFRERPELVRTARQEQWRLVEAITPFDDPALTEELRLQALRNLETVADPALRARLTPTLPLGAQRPLYSNDYYPTFNQPHVRLVDGAVVRAGAASLATAGEEVDGIDTLILATGYQANLFLSVIVVTGRGGLTIAEAWREGAQAWRGITVAGFPNLFMLYGPNTNNGSIITMLELQSAYIVEKLGWMRRQGLRWIDVKRAEMDRYNDELQQAIAEVEPWRTEGSRYYRAASGRIVTQWPHTMEAYRALLARDDLDAYETC